MSTNEFDRILADKLSKLAFAYDPGDWDNLTVQLAAARKKKRAILFAYTLSGVAASVALVLVTVLGSGSHKDAPVALSHIVPSTVVSPAPHIPSLSQNNTSVPAASHIALNMPLTHQTTTHNTVKKERIVSIVSPGVPNVEAHENKVVNAAPEPVVITAEKPVPPKVICNGLPAILPDKREREPRPVHFSLLGGVNYGTLNTGYAVAAVANKKVSDRFGVELALGYINNNGNTYTSGNVNISPPNNVIGYKPPVVKPAQLDNQPLNYLQFAPLAGYDLTRRLTLSAGADMQRLLDDHDVTIHYNDVEKVAPQLDMGLLFKTDYMLSSRLKAGVAYRAGMNNVISTGNNYVDRSYMQVQVKYRLH